jgi:hypothetical protein
VVNVFARQLTDDLASLVKQLDALVEKNAEKQLSGFIVLLSADPAADESRVQQFAEKHGIKSLPLTIFTGTDGPPSYKLAKDADVTVLMWKEQSVKANRAFAQGALNAAAVTNVVEDTAKILN